MAQSPSPLASMTAFANISQATEFGQLNWELRSLNSRYLELHFRLPETWRSLEGALRDKLKARLSRGKVDISLRWDRASVELEQHVDSERLASLLRWEGALKEQAPEASGLTVEAMLKWPGVLAEAVLDQDEVEQQALVSFDKALDKLLAERSREGESLKAVMVERLRQIDAHLGPIETQLPEVINQYKTRLIDRLNEAKAALNPERIEQEWVLLSQRLDIAEELDRLRLHLAEFQSILDKGGVAGRRLDFLTQELNREANTIASKSVNQLISQRAVDIKVLLEQLREQIQNIE